jgi:NADPH2:quinone reductase
MLAVWMDEIGGPEVLVARETPDPVPGPGEVLVDVAHVSITFVETQVRAGRGPFPATPPVIPGNGVGGTTPDGRRVVTTTGGSGGYAERVAVPEANLIDVPDEVPLDVATALLADGRTAVLLARTAAAQAGERVLVLAAAGGVGSLLVQLVGATGATVIATAGGPEKVAAVRHEVDEVHDHRIDGWADGIEPIDVVLDGVGGAVGRAVFDRLRQGGRILRFGMASGSFTEIDPTEARARDIALLDTGRPAPEEISDLTREALAAAARGELRPRIGQRRPLAEAADAHRAIEARQVIGKTVLDV